MCIPSVASDHVTSSAVVVSREILQTKPIRALLRRRAATRDDIVRQARDRKRVFLVLSRTTSRQLATSWQESPESVDGGRWAEGGGRRTEDGGRRTEDGGRRTEDGGRRTEDGGRRTEDGGRRTEDGGRSVNIPRVHVLKEPSIITCCNNNYS